MADILNKLNSANYVTVKVTDNAIVNGNNFLAAYSLAKTVTPNGAALSSSNRLAVILPAAKYDLGTQSLILDTQYIDIVGSTSDRSKHYITSNVGAANRGTVQQTANDVKLYNLTIENSNVTYVSSGISTDPAGYFPNSNLPLAYLENIKFLANDNNVFSMRTSIQYSGTYINCTGGNYSFGGGYNGGTLSGTFTDCTGGDYSFGGGYNSGGTLTSTSIFINCTGAYVSFGGADGAGGTADGNFTNCAGGYASFAGWGTASGTFKDCTGGDYSFSGGGNGTASGTFTNCTGLVASFGGASGKSSGTFINCTASDDSFGASGGKVIGIFTNCIGGNGSFNL